MFYDYGNNCLSWLTTKKRHHFISLKANREKKTKNTEILRDKTNWVAIKIRT